MKNRFLDFHLYRPFSSKSLVVFVDSYSSQGKRSLKVAVISSIKGVAKILENTLTVPLKLLLEATENGVKT